VLSLVCRLCRWCHLTAARRLRPCLQFIDGWVEFAEKKIAKRVALTLNNAPIGAKKHSFYHDDLWNIKYLKGFKWSELTEKIGYERAVRDQRIRQQMSQAKQQNKFYLQQVEAAKALNAIEQRKGAKRAREETYSAPPTSHSADAVPPASEGPPSKRPRKFHQRKTIDLGQLSTAPDDLLQQVLRRPVEPRR